MFIRISRWPALGCLMPSHKCRNSAAVACGTCLIFVGQSRSGRRQMETLTERYSGTVSLSRLVWLPSDCRQDKRNARNTHSECQSVFNEQRVLAAPSAPAPASALACCCHILRKSQNQLARNQIELRAGAGAGRGLVATAAATSQHRQCCGKAEAER